MTPEDEKAILAALESGDTRKSIGLRLGDDGRGFLFQEFTDALQSLAPGIKIEKQDSVDTLPGLKIAGNVVYRAIPQGRELSPFLDFLAGAAADGSGPLSSPVREKLEKVNLPADLKVFIAMQCPHCPETVASMLMLARYCPRIRLTVIDGELFPEAGEEFRIRSVPTVILDDQYRWAGTADVNEIADMLVRRDPVHLGMSALQQMIEDGKAGELAAMMAGSN